jgi:hypothetical protein
MTQTETRSRAPTRPARKVERPRLTTMKIRPLVAAALRLEASLHQRSTTGLLEEAILLVLKSRGRDPGPTIERDDVRPGRPGPTVITVAESLATLPLGKCVAVPTRLSAPAAHLLDSLSDELERSMGEIAEEGVLILLSKSEDEDVRVLAGLEPENSAFERLLRIAKDPKTFAESKQTG